MKNEEDMMNTNTARTQLTSTILMVRPIAFRYNEQTAKNNLYQTEPESISDTAIQNKARQEFNNFVEKLRRAGVEVIVFDDNEITDTPDSVFPNNWVSFHTDGTVALYPMWAPNRRQERRKKIITDLEEKYGFKVNQWVDYAPFEHQGKFLEGTGSLVLDRIHRYAYACLSPRTHQELIEKFCAEFNYRPVVFHAFQQVDGQLFDIYHTNVMMSVGEDIAIICAETIHDGAERSQVLETLRGTGKEIVLLTEAQNNHFAGNMLQIQNKKGEKILVMSEQAYWSLTPEQIARIEKHTSILYSNLDTIETYGGGSARCMMAEVFLPHNPEEAI